MTGKSCKTKNPALRGFWFVHKLSTFYPVSDTGFLCDLKLPKSIKLCYYISVVMANQLENILSKIVKYGLYAILLMPLVFWPRALYAFMTPKFILFQVLVEIVFAAWVAAQLLNNANDANRESGKKLAISGISKNYILLAL